MFLKFNAYFMFLLEFPLLHFVIRTGEKKPGLKQMEPCCYQAQNAPIYLVPNLPYFQAYLMPSCPDLKKMDLSKLQNEKNGSLET